MLLLQSPNFYGRAEEEEETRIPQICEFPCSKKTFKEVANGSTKTTAIRDGFLKKLLSKCHRR